MKKSSAQRKPSLNPYPQGFVYGRGQAKPWSFSLAGLKLSRCLAALSGIRQGKGLELGCGGGQYLSALSHYRPELSMQGIDLDPQAVTCAQTLPGVTCHCANAEKLPFPAKTFRVVIGFDILEHVLHPKKVLSEAFRVLKPRGILHFYIPVEGNPGTIYVRKGHALKSRWGGHIQQFTTAKVTSLLKQAGFHITRMRHADYWLTQRWDYLFFQRLSKSPHPEKLWAAQALSQGGGFYGWLLRMARRGLSAVSWLEGSLRSGPHGAMGVHVTAIKKESRKPRGER